MSDYAGWIGSGSTGPEALGKLWGKTFSSGVATATTPTAYLVTQRGSGSNMSVDIAPGSALLNLTDYGIPVWSTLANNVTVTAADPTNPRNSIVVVYIDFTAYGVNNNQGATKFKIVDGVAAGSPSDPSDSAIQTAVGLGNPWMKLARIVLPANAPSVLNTYFTDLRLPIGFSGTFSVGPNTFFWNGWQAATGSFTYAGNNGNKEFLLATSNDLRGVIQPGDKLSVVRGTVPPTQCMSFTASSSQYAANASPSGLSFTLAFTLEANVFLTAYGGANSQMIIGRLDSTPTGGYWMNLSGSGQLQISYAASSAITNWQALQSLPLNRWVHVAAVVSSTSSKTLQGIYINGVSVPTSQPSSAASSMTNTGTLCVGGWAANPSQYFPGYISEPRIWSVAQSQAAIQNNMAINLTTATNLVFSMTPGTFNDASGNGNNLTPTNSPIATQAANPFNATEYGYVTAITSNQITVFCGTDYTIPNQTLGAVTYSHDRSPYGFPTARSKWLVDMICAADSSSLPVSSTGTWFGSNLSIAVPIGPWSFRAYADVEQDNTASAASVFRIGVGATTGSTLPTLTTGSIGSSASVTFLLAFASMQDTITNTVLTLYYLNYYVETGGGTITFVFHGSRSYTRMVAELGYV